jgi:hypothetical protein
MRVLLIAVPIVSFLVSCAGPEPQRMPEAASAPAPQTLPERTSAPRSGLPLGYSLTDTTDWGNAIGEEGKRAVLRHGREIIDTVDLAFGVLAAGKDSLVFLPIRTDSVGFSDGAGSIVHESSPSVHFLWTPLRRRKLSDVLPFFNADLSSPTIADKLAIHYWGLPHRDTTCRLYAMRYDFRTARLDSLFLRHQSVGPTDYRYVFGVPQIKGAEVSFGRVVVDRGAWHVIRKDPPANPSADSAVAEGRGFSVMRVAELSESGFIDSTVTLMTAALNTQGTFTGDKEAYEFSGSKEAFEDLSKISSALPPLVDCLGWDQMAAATYKGTRVLVGVVCYQVLIRNQLVKKLISARGPNGSREVWVDFRNPAIADVRKAQAVWRQLVPTGQSDPAVGTDCIAFQ